MILDTTTLDQAVLLICEADSIVRYIAQTPVPMEERDRWAKAAADKLEEADRLLG